MKSSRRLPRPTPVLFLFLALAVCALAQQPAPAPAIPTTGFAGLDQYRASRIAVFTDDYGQLARYRQAYAFAHLPASLSSVSLLIQPVMASLFAWRLFGEAIGVTQFVGGAIVLAGIWIARRGS